MAYSIEELRKSNIPDESLISAMKSRPFPIFPPDFFEERAARAAHLSTLRHLMPVPGPIPEQVTEQELLVTARDGYQIRVIHYKPASPPTKSRPLIVLYHEGGWGMGDLSDEEFNARLFSRDLDAICLNVEYRLAPEHVFPTWINDCWDVLKWAASNAASLGADPAMKGFIVGGSSAGGNISASLAHLSRNEGLNPPVTGQWLSVPYLLPSKLIPDRYKDIFISPIENIHDPIIKGGPDNSTESALQQSTKFDTESSLFSMLAKDIYPPTEANSAGKGPLAKAFIQVAGLDPLRDHGIVYDRMLREEYGTESRVKLYPGFGHMFWTNWPEMEASKQYAIDLLEGFRWLLDS